MWCRHCQQDVPAVAQAAEGRVQCPRCQRTLGAEARPTAFAANVNDAGVDLSGQTSSHESESVVFEPWTLDEVLGEDDRERLAQIGQQLRSTRLPGGRKPAQRTFRADAAQPEVRPHLGPERPVLSSAPPAVREPARPSQLAAWVAAIVGALTLGAGIGLLGWSLFGPRPDLWNWGLAATLAGQGLMIVGLVQLLANLWTSGRDAANRLISLQYELRRLQRTADSLAGMRTASPGAFYADLARGSSPQILLANLKGQMEELTTRMTSD